MKSKLIFVVLLLAGIMGLAVFSAGKMEPLPSNEKDAQTRIDNSPRHGEWVTIDAGMGDKVDAWIVYPERKEKAPVVIVIHEIFGLNVWARAIADDLAKEGFIAVAPDLLSGKGPDGKGTASLDVDKARAINSALDRAEVTRRIDATAKYATNLPAATKKFGIVGFCWGGGTSFAYATSNPDLGASVVYYGPSPAVESLATIKAPVLGLYGGNDSRINSGIPAVETEMKKLGKRYEVNIYPGAGHAFLRQQDGMDGANLEATRKAWPRTISFFRELLGS